MKITRIRWIDASKGKNLDRFELESVVIELRNAFERKGFITDVYEDRGSIKIGLHMRSFRINTRMHGHNADVSEWAQKKCKLGFKRTDTPTWEQREQFNHTINDVLDEFGIKANAKNSVLKIRDFHSGRVNNWDMDRFSPMGSRAYYEIQKISDLEPPEPTPLPKKQPHLRLVHAS